MENKHKVKNELGNRTANMLANSKTANLRISVPPLTDRGSTSNGGEELPMWRLHLTMTRLCFKQCISFSELHHDAEKISCLVGFL